MDEKIYSLKITTVEPILGTQPQKDIATIYVTGEYEKRPDKEGIPVNGAGLPADEVETLDEMLEKGTTSFHKLDGKPILYDYHIKGFLKASAQVQNGARGVKNLRSKFVNLVFVRPRRIMLNLPDGGEMSFIERPISAMTAQGPRTALARSEALPAGTWLECKLVVLGSTISEPLLRDILYYGQYCGLGQWRGGSYGTFEYELNEE